MKYSCRCAACCSRSPARAATFNFSDGDCDQFLAKIAKPMPWIRRCRSPICKAASSARASRTRSASTFPNARISPGRSTTRDFVLSDYFVRLRAPRFAIIRRVATDRRRRRSSPASCSASRPELARAVANDFVTPSGSMLMIDGSGIVLAQYPNGQNLVGHDFKDEALVQDMLTSSSGLVTEPAPRRCPPHLRLRAIARHPGAHRGRLRRRDGSRHAPTMECGPRWRNSVR